VGIRGATSDPGEDTGVSGLPGGGGAVSKYYITNYN